MRGHESLCYLVDDALQQLKDGHGERTVARDYLVAWTHCAREKSCVNDTLATLRCATVTAAGREMRRERACTAVRNRDATFRLINAIERCEEINES